MDGGTSSGEGDAKRRPQAENRPGAPSSRPR